MWFWGINIPNSYSSGTARAQGVPHDSKAFRVNSKKLSSCIAIASARSFTTLNPQLTTPNHPGCAEVKSGFRPYRLARNTFFAIFGVDFWLLYAESV